MLEEFRVKPNSQNPRAPATVSASLQKNLNANVTGDITLKFYSQLSSRCLMTSENIIQGNTIKSTLKSLNKRCPVPAHTQDTVSCQVPALAYVLVGGSSEQAQIFTCLKLIPLWTPSAVTVLGARFTHRLISDFYSNKLSVTRLT